MGRPVDLNDVRLLAQVVEHGSFTAASRAIGIPKSTISQRIAALERAVGTGLLRRTSRSFSLTDAGAKLMPQARAIEELARQVERVLHDDGRELHGSLRISCSNAVAQFALSPVVPVFLQLHPAATIRVEPSNRLVDIVAEGYDMTVRGHAGPLQDSSLVQRVVARSRWSLVASPAWGAAHGWPREPEDIAGRTVLSFPAAPRFPHLVLAHGDDERSIEVVPQLTVDDMASLRGTAIAGGGIAYLPDYVLAEPLRDGTLVHVLPGWALPGSLISVLTPPRAQSSRLCRAFSDFLAEHLPTIIGTGRAG